MKKLLFLLLVLLSLISINTIGQSKWTEKEVKQMLCHKWKVNSVVMQGEQTFVMENVYLEFLENGVFNNSMKRNIHSKDKWTYIHSTMTVTTGGIPKKILFIDSTQLKLNSKTDGKNTTMLLTRVD
jgi:hypothetical protein